MLPLIVQKTAICPSCFHRHRLHSPSNSITSSSAACVDRVTQGRSCRWWCCRNLMRFLTAGELSVRELAPRALITESQLKFELGCLERWGFLELRPDADDDRPISKRIHNRSSRIRRDGWGSGRGIRTQWLIRLTEESHKAAEFGLRCLSTSNRDGRHASAMTKSKVSDEIWVPLSSKWNWICPRRCLCIGPKPTHIRN